MTTKEQIAAHTPGPWTAIQYQSCAWRICDCLGDDVVASLYTHRDQGEDNANARLIAVAPDLLDVARTIVAICESGNVEHARLACDENSPLVDAARAAIAKAEGRS